MMDEHRLYKKLTVFINEWLVEENKSGRKPYQSEVVGALEMVKCDMYALQSSERILVDKLHKIFTPLVGKSIQIDKNSIIIVENEKKGDE